MKLQRTLAFSRRALLQFRHDRRTFAFVLVMPLLMILIFGYTFGGDVKGITVEVVNQDSGFLPGSEFPFIGSNDLILGNNITQNLNTDTLSIHFNTNSENARQLVRDGKAWSAIIFPANFTQNFLASLLTPGRISSPKIELY